MLPFDFQNTDICRVDSPMLVSKQSEGVAADGGARSNGRFANLMANQNLEARSSRARNILFCLMLMPGTLVLGELISKGQVNVLRAAVIAAAIGGAAWFWPRTELVLRDGVLHGPRPWGFGRTSIALADLDRDRSRVRRGRGIIRSVRGDAIWVDSISIPAPSRRRLLEALGMSLESA